MKVAQHKPQSPRWQRRSKSAQPSHGIMLSNRKKRSRAAARVARKARRISRRSRR